MSRMIFDLTDDDRDALERLRAARGLRSNAEVLRALIRENTADGFTTVGVVDTPRSDRVVDLGVGAASARVKGVIEEPKAQAPPTKPPVPYGSRLKKPKGK